MGLPDSSSDRLEAYPTYSFASHPFAPRTVCLKYIERGSKVPIREERQMFHKRLAIIAVGICLAAVATAWTEDGQRSGPNTAPPPAAPEEIGQVKVYRLHHAEAAPLVNELSQVLDSRRVRLAAYPAGNCIIVAGPSNLQGTMAKLIQRLDAPSSPNGVGAVSPPSNAKRTGPPPADRLPPPAGGTAQDRLPAQNEDDVIRVIRVSGRDLAALAQALSELARARQGSVRTVVVTPSREKEPAQKATRPTEVKRR